MRCQPGKHKDRLLRGGHAVVCEVCKDRFPCERLLCGHLDCNAERTEPGSMIGGELGFDVKEGSDAVSE